MIHNLMSAMLEQANLKDIIKKCSQLATYVKNSGLNRKLKTLLKAFVPTRWNSVFIMIESIINNYRDVYDLMHEKQRILNDHNRNQNKKLENIMDYLTTLNMDELIRIKKFL